MQRVQLTSVASAVGRVVSTQRPDKLQWLLISHGADFRGCLGALGGLCRVDSGGGVMHEHTPIPPGWGGHRRQGGT